MEVLSLENYFGSNLKFLRTVKKVEQDEIAKLVGLKSSSGISEWEKGLRLPTIGKLAILANFFDCTIDELVREDMSAIKTKESNIIFSDDDDLLSITFNAIKGSRTKGIGGPSPSSSEILVLNVHLAA